ncbi:MAG TPA: Hpt domain-containing protein, partial [Polyangiaceae bacterium]|nr:Hpt domain-containing protein [Polyangiaceae bacterium]
MTAILLKDLIDDLVTLCLGASLDDADAFARAGDLLAKILGHDTLLQDRELVRRTRDLRASIEGSHRPGEAPPLRTAQQLVQSLEELSYELYTLAREHAQLEPDPSPCTELKLPPEADAQIFGEFLSNARLALDDLELEIEAVRQGAIEAVAAVKRRIHSLKGESGMLELTDLEQVLHATETFLERQMPTWDRADRLVLVRDWVDDALKAYAKFQHPPVPSHKILNLLSVQSQAPAALTPQVRTASPAAVPANVEASGTRLAEQRGSSKTTSVLDSAQGSLPSPVGSVTVRAQPGSDIPAATWGTNSQTTTAENATCEPCPWGPDDDDLVVEFLHEVEEHL